MAKNAASRHSLKHNTPKVHKITLSHAAQSSNTEAAHITCSTTQKQHISQKQHIAHNHIEMD